MSKISSFTLILLSTILWSCANDKRIDIVVKNNASLALKDARVDIAISQLMNSSPDLNTAAIRIKHNDKEIPFQITKGQTAKLLFVIPIASEEETVVTLSYQATGAVEQSFPKRTQAELSHKEGGYFENQKYIDGQFKNISYERVPDEHWDHSTYFRYEGPGWESDLVGYRFYLDWRNAIDIFGKKTTDMVLQNVGQDGFDSYHEMADWGMDILKVGSSLGIGSIGQWKNNKVHMVSKTDSVTCAILSNGPVYSQIRTSYYGWQVGNEKGSIVSDLSISAGDRKTLNEIKLTDGIDNICTGLVKHENGDLIISDTEGNWQYMATYGQQSLANDHHGMAILYDKRQKIMLTEDEQSHIVVLKPKVNKISYYFLAAWEKEPEGIKDLKQFTQYLDHKLILLDNPVTFRLK